MSRFNTLYLGQADDAANELEDDEGSVNDVKFALINALRRIAVLEANERERNSAKMQIRAPDAGAPHG